jgi:hypothetical protein
MENIAISYSLKKNIDEKDVAPYLVELMQVLVSLAHSFLS